MYKKIITKQKYYIIIFTIFYSLIHINNIILSVDPGNPFDPTSTIWQPTSEQQPTPIDLTKKPLKSALKSTRPTIMPENNNDTMDSDTEKQQYQILSIIADSKTAPQEMPDIQSITSTRNKIIDHIKSIASWVTGGKIYDNYDTLRKKRIQDIHESLTGDTDKLKNWSLHDSFQKINKSDQKQWHIIHNNELRKQLTPIVFKMSPDSLTKLVDTLHEDSLTKLVDTLHEVSPEKANHLIIKITEYKKQNIETQLTQLANVDFNTAKQIIIKIYTIIEENKLLKKMAYEKEVKHITDKEKKIKEKQARTLINQSTKSIQKYDSIDNINNVLPIIFDMISKSITSDQEIPSLQSSKNIEQTGTKNIYLEKLTEPSRKKKVSFTNDKKSQIKPYATTIWEPKSYPEEEIITKKRPHYYSHFTSEKTHKSLNLDDHKISQVTLRQLSFANQIAQIKTLDIFSTMIQNELDKQPASIK